MNIYDLPLDVLKTLCQYFPLMALYTLAEAIEPTSEFVALLREQVLPHRASLTLLVGPVEEEEEDENKNETDFLNTKMTYANTSSVCYFDLLHFDQLTVDRAQWLTENLPNITQLTVSVRKSDSSVMPLITSLLTAWSPKLTDLTLFINLQSGESLSSLSSNASRLHALILAINLYCTWLRHLRVHLFDQKLFPSLSRLEQHSTNNHHHHHPSLDLPILGQLESFSFTSGDSIACLLKSLRHWAAPNERLATLEVGCPLVDLNSFLELIRLPPQEFRRKFRRLGGDHFRVVANDWTVFDWLVDAFSGLVELHLRLNSPSQAESAESSSLKEAKSANLLETTFRQLARLTRLESLELLVASIPGTFHWRALNNSERQLQLPSVTSLTLTTVTNSHYDLSFFAAHRLFPRLEHFTLAIDERVGPAGHGKVRGERPLSLNHFHCHRCKWWAEVLLDGDTSSFDRCTQKAFRCLKKCPHLKTARLQLSSSGKSDKSTLPLLPHKSYKQLWLPEEI